MSKKVYVASGLGNAENARKIQQFMRDAGWEITYDWTWHGSIMHLGPERIREVSVAEFEGVRDADLIVVVLPGGRGTHVEFGMAMAWGKPALIYAPNGAEVVDGKSCSFYSLPWVQIVRSETELIEKLPDVSEEGWCVV